MMSYTPSYYYFQSTVTNQTPFPIEPPPEVKPQTAKQIADAERKRKRRQNMTPEQLLDVRAKEAERKRLLRSRLPPEKLAEVRAKDAARKRIYRAQLSMKASCFPEKLAELRAKDAERKRLKRSTMTNEQLMQRRAKDAAYKRMYREQMRQQKQNPMPHVTTVAAPAPTAQTMQQLDNWQRRPNTMTAVP